MIEFMIIVGMLVVYFILARLMDRPPPKKYPYYYRYTYQRHPFDDPQYFYIQANSSAEADEKAVQEFERIIDTSFCVVHKCYRSYEI